MRSMPYVTAALCLVAFGSMAATGNPHLSPTDPLAGEFPEDIALAVDGSSLLVSHFVANHVAVFDPSSLQSVGGFDVVAPTGVTALAGGDTLVATAPWFQGVFLAGAPDPTLAASQGVWRIAADGTTSQVATLPFEGVLPNGIASDDAGNVYVSNLIGDEIYRVDPAGQVSVWLRDSRLAGDGGADSSSPSPGFSLGGNGLQFVEGRLVASNTDAGAIFSIAIDAQGAAGDIETIADSTGIVGIDGFQVASDGTLYGANLLTDELFSVTADGEFAILAAFDDGLRAPTGVALSEETSELFFTNFSAPFPFLSQGSTLQPGVGRLALVPEPATAALALLAGSAALFKRRTMTV